MEFYLIRHTTTAVPQGTCYGRSDVGVSSGFAAEADRTAAGLGGVVSTARVVSSPLRRCRRLADHLTLPERVAVDERLLEQDLGELEGLCWDEIHRRGMDGWMADFVETAPPDGERLRDVAERSWAFAEECAAQGGTVVAVTHAGVIRCLVARALGIPLENVFRLQVAYGGVTRLDARDGRWELVFLNR